MYGELDRLFEALEWDVRPTRAGNGLWRRREVLVTLAGRARHYHLAQNDSTAQATQSRHVKPSGTDAAKISRHKPIPCRATAINGASEARRRISSGHRRGDALGNVLKRRRPQHCRRASRRNMSATPETRLLPHPCQPLRSSLDARAAGGLLGGQDPLLDRRVS